MSHDTSVIIMLLGNHVPLPKQLRHHLYFLTLKGKKPQNYSFVKSFLQTNIKFTFLLKVPARKAESVKRSHGAFFCHSDMYSSFLELCWVMTHKWCPGLQKTEDSYNIFQDISDKNHTHPSVYSTRNPTWPFLPKTEKNTWSTCQVILWNLKTISMDFQ